jgi:hypothetical protein
MVPSHRRALRARLLSFRYIDGLCFREKISTQRLGVARDKVTAGLNPADPAKLEN